jgi:Xaa-Pro aminopeptidase
VRLLKAFSCQLVMLLSLVSSFSGQQAVTVTQSLRKMDQDLLNAIAPGNRKAWDDAMSPDFLYADENNQFNPSQTRYDHLDRVMKVGELVRLDDSCSVNHYASDLGRTVPASGHFTAEQREVWNASVAAYRAGVKTIREGATVDQVFAAWLAELLLHRATVRTSLAREAIETWSRRENVDAFFLHTLNPNENLAQEPFRAGTAIAFEPQASIHGQAFFMEDNFIITVSGTELLTPGMPYTAEEIEEVMRTGHRN